MNLRYITVTNTFIVLGCKARQKLHYSRIKASRCLKFLSVPSILLKKPNFTRRSMKCFIFIVVVVSSVSANVDDANTIKRESKVWTTAANRQEESLVNISAAGFTLLFAKYNSSLNSLASHAVTTISLISTETQAYGEEVAQKIFATAALAGVYDITDVRSTLDTYLVGFNASMDKQITQNANAVAARVEGSSTNRMDCWISNRDSIKTYVDAMFSSPGSDFILPTISSSINMQHDNARMVINSIAQGYYSCIDMITYQLDPVCQLNLVSLQCVHP